MQEYRAHEFLKCLTQNRVMNTEITKGAQACAQVSRASGMVAAEKSTQWSGHHGPWKKQTVAIHSG